MDLGRIILGIGAVLLCLGTILTGVDMQKQVNTYNKEQAKKIEIPIAKNQLNANDVITPEDYELITVDKSKLPENVILNDTEIVGYCIQNDAFVVIGDFFRTTNVVECDSISDENIE